MASQTSTIDASVAVGGNVDRSAIVTGNHNDVVVVNNYHGVQMGKVGADARPSPKLRPTPVLRPTRRFKNPVGRKAEIERVKAALADQVSLCWHGEDGLGKTVLLKILEHDIDLADYPHGLFHFLVEDTAIDEVRANIFDAFYECDVPFKPNKSQFRHYMKDVCAVVVLDDVNLNAKEIEALYDDIEQCVLLIASEKPIHFSDAEIEVLQGLPQEEAISYLEQQLKRPLEANEKPLAAELCSLRQGQPMHLKLDASNIRGGEKTFEQIISAEKPSGEESTQKAAVDSGIDQSQREAARLLAALQGALTSPDLIASLTKNLGQKSSGASDETADQQDLLKHLSDIGLAHSGSGYRLRSDLQQEIQRTTDLTPYREQLLQHFLATANQYEDNQQRFLEDVGPLLGILHWAADQQKWSELLGLSMAIQGHLWNAKRWTTWGKVLELVLRASEALGDRYHVGWAKHQLGTLAAIRHDDLREPRQSVNAYRQFHLLNEARRIRESLGDPLALGITQNNLAIARKRWHRRLMFLGLLGLLLLLLSLGGTSAVVIRRISNDSEHKHQDFKIERVSIRAGGKQGFKLRLTEEAIEHAKEESQQSVVFDVHWDKQSGLSVDPPQLEIPIDKPFATFVVHAQHDYDSSREDFISVTCRHEQTVRIPVHTPLRLQALRLPLESVVAGDAATIKLKFNRSPTLEERAKLKLHYSVLESGSSADSELNKAFEDWPRSGDCSSIVSSKEGTSLSVTLDTPPLKKTAKVWVVAEYAGFLLPREMLTITPVPTKVLALALTKVTPDPAPVVAANTVSVTLLLNRVPTDQEKKQSVDLRYLEESLKSLDEETQTALKKASDAWPRKLDWKTLVPATNTGGSPQLSLSLKIPKIYRAAALTVEAQYADSPAKTSALKIEPLLAVKQIAFAPSSVRGGEKTQVTLLLNRVPTDQEKKQSVDLRYLEESLKSLDEETQTALKKASDAWPRKLDWKTLVPATNTGGSPQLSLSLKIPKIYRAAALTVEAQYADSPAKTSALKIEPLLAVKQIAFAPSSVRGGEKTQVTLLLNRVPTDQEKKQSVDLRYLEESLKSLDEETQTALKKASDAWPRKLDWKTLVPATNTGGSPQLSLSLKIPKIYRAAALTVEAQYADSPAKTSALKIEPLLAVKQIAFAPSSVRGGEKTQVTLLLNRVPTDQEKKQSVDLRYLEESLKSLDEETQTALKKASDAWPRKLDWKTLVPATNTGGSPQLSLSLKIPKIYRAAALTVEAQYADSPAKTSALKIEPLLAVKQIAFAPSSVRGGEKTQVTLLLNRVPTDQEKKQSVDLRYLEESLKSLDEETQTALKKASDAWPRKLDWKTLVPATNTGGSPQLSLSLKIPKIYRAAALTVEAQYADSPAKTSALKIEPLLAVKQIAFAPSSVRGGEKTQVTLLLNRVPTDQEKKQSVDLRYPEESLKSLDEETQTALKKASDAWPRKLDWKTLVPATNTGGSPQLSLSLKIPKIYRAAALTVEAQYADSPAKTSALKIEPLLAVKQIAFAPSSVRGGEKTQVTLLLNRVPTDQEKKQSVDLRYPEESLKSLDEETQTALKKASDAWPRKLDWKTLVPATNTGGSPQLSLSLKIPKIYRAAALTVEAQYADSPAKTSALKIEPLLAVKQIAFAPSSVRGGEKTQVTLLLNRVPTDQEKKQSVDLRYPEESLKSLDEETQTALKKASDAWPRKLDWKTLVPATNTGGSPQLSLSLKIPKIYRAAALTVEAQYADSPAITKSLAVEKLKTRVTKLVIEDAVTKQPGVITGGHQMRVAIEYEGNDVENAWPVEYDISDESLKYYFYVLNSFRVLEQRIKLESALPGKVNLALGAPLLYDEFRFACRASIAANGILMLRFKQLQVDAPDSKEGTDAQGGYTKNFTIQPTRVTELLIKDALTKQSYAITGGHQVNVVIVYEGDKVEDLARVGYVISSEALKIYFESLKWLHFLDDGIELRHHVDLRKATSSLKAPPAVHKDVEFALTAKIEAGELHLTLTERQADVPKAGWAPKQGSYTRYFTIRSPRPESVKLDNPQKLSGGSTMEASIRLDGPAPGAYGDNSNFEVELYLEPIENNSSPKPDASSGSFLLGDDETFVAFLDDSKQTKEVAESSSHPAKVLQFKSGEVEKTFDLPLPPVNRPTEYKIVAKRNGQSYVLKTITVVPPQIKEITLRPNNPVEGGELVTVRVVLDGNAGTAGICLDLDYQLLQEKLEEYNLGLLNEAKKNWPTLVEVVPGKNVSAEFVLHTVPFHEQVLVKIKIEASYSYPGYEDKDKPYSKKAQVLTLEPLPVVLPAKAQCAAPQPCRGKIRVFSRRRR